MKKKTTNGHRLFIQLTHHTIAPEVLDDVPQIEKTKFRIHGYKKLLMLANTNHILPGIFFLSVKVLF